MLPSFPSVTRALRAAPALLALTLAYSCSQSAEAPAPGSTTRPALNMSNAVIYIDAQRQDSVALHALNPQDIASLNVLKGEEARDYDPSASGAGVLVVTTKQNEHRPDVVAFNARQNLRAGTPAETAARLPADAAYFLNGRASTRAIIARLDPKTVTRTSVLQGRQAAAFAHDEKVQHVISVYAN